MERSIFNGDDVEVSGMDGDDFVTNANPKAPADDDSLATPAKVKRAQKAHLDIFGDVDESEDMCVLFTFRSNANWSRITLQLPRASWLGCPSAD